MHICILYNCNLKTKAQAPVEKIYKKIKLLTTAPPSDQLQNFTCTPKAGRRIAQCKQETTARSSDGCWLFIYNGSQNSKRSTYNSL